MTKMTRRHAAPQPRATPTSPADVPAPQRDFREMPVDMRQRPAAGPQTRVAPGSVDGPATQIIPLVEQTIVLGVVRPAESPPALADRRASKAQPTDIKRSRGQVALTLLIPPLKHLYRGGMADLPAADPVDEVDANGDWADLPLARGRRRRDPNTERTRDSVAGNLALARQRVIAPTRPNPLAPLRVDQVALIRQADAAAQANDARMDAIARNFERWSTKFTADLTRTGHGLADMSAHTNADQLAMAYDEGGTSVALYTAAELAHAIAERALSNGVNA